VRGRSARSTRARAGHAADVTGDHLVAEVVRDPRREAARAGLAHEDLEEGRPGLLIGAPLPQVANLEARDHGEEDHRTRDAALLGLHRALLGDEDLLDLHTRALDDHGPVLHVAVGGALRIAAELLHVLDHHGPRRLAGADRALASVHGGELGAFVGGDVGQEGGDGHGRAREVGVAGERRGDRPGVQAHLEVFAGYIEDGDGTTNGGHDDLPGARGGARREPLTKNTSG
jgi:hypothetical protein